jgi:hypothetical protein
MAGKRNERENVGHPRVGYDPTTADVILRLGNLKYAFDHVTAVELGRCLLQAAEAVAPKITH